MTEQHFPARSILFHEGEAASRAYILRQGAVEILKSGSNGEIRLATIEKADEVFGEMALFEAQGKRSATARAITETTVDSLSREEFEALLGQCPPRIMPVIQTVMERLRQSNQRLSQTEQASVLLDSEIERIEITPASAALQFEPVTALVARLPFRIGAYGSEGTNTKNRQNHLNLAFTESPAPVSRQHCQIEIMDNGIYLVDLGSRTTCVVNGQQIGRAKGKYKMPLQKGANELILGGYESPYKLHLDCA
jgi:CRP-like cAMP-binding protein